VLINCKSIIIYDKISNTTGATSGARTAYPSGAPEFTPVFSGVCVTRSLVLCVIFVDRVCSLVLFVLAIVLSVLLLLVIVLSVLLRFTDSDYPFGIFKLFLKRGRCITNITTRRKDEN